LGEPDTLPESADRAVSPRCRLLVGRVFPRSHSANVSGLPERPFNWTLYVFYGGDIRKAELPWLAAGQVESMAALPPVDDDGDMPVGLFVVSDERAVVSVWKCVMGWPVTGLLLSWNGYSASECRCPASSLLCCVSEESIVREGHSVTASFGGILLKVSRDVPAPKRNLGPSQVTP
jgi:hypothetical protein